MRAKGLELDPATPARLAAAIALILGLLTLTGWVFDIRLLESILPHAVAMKMNTAVSIIALATALIVLVERAPPHMERIAQALAGIGALLGLATLIEYSTGWNLHIDEPLIKDTIRAYNLFPGRMSPFTAAALVPTGIAIAAMPLRASGAVTKGGAVVAIGTAFVPLLGYLWNAGELVTDSWLPPVALNTATCFLMIGVGILLSPRRTDRPLAQRIAALPAIETRTLLGFILAFSLLLVGGGYAYRTNVQFAASVDWVSRTEQVRDALSSVYGSLAGAELAERDYFIAPEPSRLEECNRLVAEVRTQMSTLAQLVVDNPTQQRNLQSLSEMVNGRLADIADALDAFQNVGLPAARAVLAHTRNVYSVLQVRNLIERMDALEVQYLGDRRAATANARHSTLISLLITILVASAVFAALFVSIQREMRARREAEQALRKSERYSRSIVESSPDSLAMLNLEGRVDEITAQGCLLMEIDDVAAVARSRWIDLWTGNESAAAEKALIEARAGGTGRFQGYRPTFKGTPKWWDVIVRPVLGADGRPESLLAVSRDISEVKRAEAELLDTNRFLDSLIENLPVMVVLKDAENLAFVRHNRAFERLIGFSREQLTGRTAYSLFKQEEADFIVAKDREALESGQLVEIPEQTIVTPHSGPRTFHTMKMPLGGLDGKPQYLLAISVDITERRRAELAVQELNTALELKAEQLQATIQELESFSYSVSHDLRAPLRAIDGFAMMLEEDYAGRLDAEADRYLAVIRENSKRMGVLIDDLLAFSRLGRLPVTTREVNVDSLVREVIAEVLHGHAGPAPEIDVTPLPPVTADPTLLRQVWTNLVSNAVKYSSKSPQPRIEIAGEHRPGENRYSVRDNGVGFNMDYVHKLFGVFQRLHRADEFSGTGVGLAIVHRVVTRHGGRVWAEGKVDQGAAFAFSLPA
jgi:PAS domain S-box-containing protein